MDSTVEKKTLLRRMIKASIFSFLLIYALYLGYRIDLPYIKFIPSTVAIILITILFYKKIWLELLGLRATLKQAACALALSSLFCAISYPVIIWSLSVKGYSLIYQDIFGYLLVPFQTLNEEVIFRALFLGLLLKLGLSKTKTIVLPALVFSVFHWIFYNSLMLPENQGIVQIEALVTLFMFGIAANSLFLKYRNIYFPWALHCGWNIHRFGSKIVPDGELNPANRVKEYMTFNLLEGSLPITILSILLAAACFILYAKGNRVFAKVA